MKKAIIAEIGYVHNWSFDNTCKRIKTVPASGTDIVKFQADITEIESLANAPTPPYFSGEPNRDYFRRAAFTQAQCSGLERIAEGAAVG